MPALRVLVVDDELPVREELGYLLQRDERVAEVTTAESGAEALTALDRGDIDAVFLDIAMPDFSGLDVARVLAKFRASPAVVFVTAHDEHAVEAFEINAVDYLLKPVREERVAEAIRRVVEGVEGSDDVLSGDVTIPVELGGVTRFVRRSEVQYVEAQGDYVRLHTADGSHLLRAPLSTLQERWRDADFLRVHRSLLVAIHHISQVRFDKGRCTVLIGDVELQVSRRHTPELRERLVRQARPGKDTA
jgi:DNA-binding LytR/AlgR family response regulator